MILHHTDICRGHVHKLGVTREALVLRTRGPMLYSTQPLRSHEPVKHFKYT